MKLPAEIKGKNKIRDFKICELYLAGLNAPEIWDTFAKRNITISLRRIHQIISENSAFINPRIAWPKTKRIHRLQRIAEKLSDKISPKKDILNVLAEIRTEVEGVAPLIDQSTHYHLTKMSDEQLINAARERRLSLPASVAARAGTTGQEQPS